MSRAVVLGAAVCLCLACAPGRAGAADLRAALDGLRTDSGGWVSYAGFDAMKRFQLQEFTPTGPVRMPGFAAFANYDPIPQSRIGPMPPLRMQTWLPYAPLQRLPVR